MEILWFLLAFLTAIIYTKSKYNPILKLFFYAWIFLIGMSASIYILLTNANISTLPSKDKVVQFLTQTNNQPPLNLHITDAIQENGRYVIDVSYYLEDKSCESKLYLLREYDKWLISERNKICKNLTKL
jgi:disulfide bond formation protein DsbB